jgi:predicted DNA-binding protein
MPAKNPRVNVVLEAPLYEAVGRLAKKEGVSLSLKVRDLVREAVELYEDEYLATVAADREKTFVRSKALSHSHVWSHLKAKKAA